MTSVDVGYDTCRTAGHSFNQKCRYNRACMLLRKKETCRLMFC